MRKIIEKNKPDNFDNSSAINLASDEEWQNKIDSSSTLSYCHSQKMKLVCISRQAYTKKESSLDVIKILKQFPKFRLIPEGGSEILGVKGCSEILTIKDLKFDVICSSVGSGGTIAGLIKSSSKNQKVLGFNALKNPSVNGVISTYTHKKNWEINSNEITGESTQLSLDSTLSRTKLGWEPVWNHEQSILKTADWYKNFLSNGSIKTLDNVDEYINEAIRKEIIWTKN